MKGNNSIFLKKENGEAYRLSSIVLIIKELSWNNLKLDWINQQNESHQKKFVRAGFENYCIMAIFSIFKNYNVVLIKSIRKQIVRSSRYFFLFRGHLSFFILIFIHISEKIIVFYSQIEYQRIYMSF